MSANVPAAMIPNQNIGSPGLSSPLSEGRGAGWMLVVAVLSLVAFCGARIDPPYFRSGDWYQLDMTIPAQAPAPAVNMVSATTSTAGPARATAGLSSIS